MSGVIDLQKRALILASSSPRRRELLAHLGIPFTVVVPAIEEKKRPDEGILAYVQRNAKEKACAALALAAEPQNTLVIGADTIGWFQEHLLEKPRDEADAAAMLSLLSGQTHEVLTAVAVVRHAARGQEVWEKLVSTKVRFKTLSASDIDYYVRTGEPLDKAGSYGIQGIGGFMVQAIEGSYSNVVGLPLVELTELLQTALTCP